MLKDNSQLKLSLSPYQGIYDAIIPADHLLRKMKENIDFSFINPMLRKQYCENFGRPAKEPEMMFKLLFLKKLYDLSDETLISSAQTDMAYKFFLDLEPEAKMIDPSLLTKFRKTRITEDILEEMLRETIQQALDKGLIKSGTIIVDSTHTNASVRAKSPTQILRDMSKQLRKEIYKNAFELSEKFPEKPSLEAGLEEEIVYTKELLKALEEDIATCGNGKVQELSREELSNKCNDYIEIIVNDSAKACTNIEKLGFNDYSVMEDGSIHIYKELERLGEINRELVLSGCTVNSIKVVQENLENYFLNLTGGVQNA